MLYTMKQKIRVICFVKKNIFLDASGIHASFSFRRNYCTCLRARVHLHRPNQKETAVFRLQQMTFETVQRENSTPWLHHFLHHKSTPESVGLLARCKKKNQQQQNINSKSEWWSLVIVRWLVLTFFSVCGRKSSVLWIIQKQPLWHPSHMILIVSSILQNKIWKFYGSLILVTIGKKSY